MIPLQRSHDGTDRWHRTFPGRREQIREARRFVQTHLPNHPDAGLIATELATNAVGHTRTGEPGGTFTATIKQQPDGSVHMEIADQGGPTTFGQPAPDREGGRGFHLVEALTIAWGVKGDATGRTIWAELHPSDS